MSEEPIVSTQVEDYFPFDEVRAPQRRAFEAITKAELKNKKFIILELPTGVGKSAIGITAARYWTHNRVNESVYKPGGYILTTSLHLQKQYLRDFEPKGLVELKGSSNYYCENWELDCSAGGKLEKAKNALAEEGSGGCQGCPYKRAKAHFIANPVGVTNFAYFLNETKYVRQLPSRQSLIIDEAHNSERELLGFADIEITKNRCEEVGVRLPIFETGENTKVLDFIYKKYMPLANALEEKLKAEMGIAARNDQIEEAKEISKKHDFIDKFLCKVRRFDETNLNDWFVNTDPVTGALHIKPLTASMFSEELLFSKARKVILMSATILDKITFARNLGIDMSQAGFLRLESDFPVENRRIFFLPTGKMSASCQEETLPKMLKRIERILDKKFDEKGIIHTNSYKIQKAIVDYLSGTKHKSRLLYHGSSAVERAAAITEHTTSLEPTVLISPSMTEGLDLRDDLSRWQVITKVPYPYLGDKYVRTRMERDPDWYMWSTALTLVQATGRSIRSKEDYAVTYVLDSDFGHFLARASKMLPDWWLQSIVYPNT